jgi:hypothetical protein
MVRTDGRDRWPADELVDRRVRHWWDADRDLGRTLALSPLFEQWKPVVWDVWLLYDAAARWDAEVPAPIGSGRTIVETRRELTEALQRLPSAW